MYKPDITNAIESLNLSNGSLIEAALVRYMGANDQMSTIL